MTSTSAIISDIDTFVAAQNKNRGQALLGGGTLPLDYDALTGAVPAGGNSVTGVSEITSGAGSISLSTANGNVVIVDGSISTAASTSGTDSYSLLVNSSGAVSLTDNNTGNSEAISGASYILFDGAATTTTGAYQSIYLIETGVAAQIAAMYNAAFGRVPDLAGLEFYIDQYGTAVLPDLHTAATYFMGSAEFKALYPALQTTSDDGGPNDQAFIAELYGNILHRTPTAAEVNYYVEALQGTLTTSSGAAIPAADRATLLEYFSASPENQADIAASNGGWLINPANGTVNLGAPLSAAELVSEGVSTGTINTALIGTVNSSTYASSGGITIEGQGSTEAVGLPAAANEVSVSVNNITITLSTNINTALASGTGEVVYGSQSGSSTFIFGDAVPVSANINNGGTAYMYGTGNTIDSNGTLSGVTTPVMVSGFVAGDFIHPYGSTVGILVSGTASSPISGANYWFSGNSNGLPQAGTLAVNVGSVSGDTAAAMATAANAVYKVGDVTGESVIFFGEDPNGNTVVFDWGHGDINKDHLVDANAFNGAEILVGVASSSVQTSWFH